MKKSILISCLLLLLVVVTGCGSKSDKAKTMTCTMNGTVMEGLTLDTTYKVTYSDKYVDVVETIEKIKAEDASVLDVYKETVESMYSPYKDVKYYDYSVKIDGNTLTSKVKIDYSKIDTKKMIEINSANSALIKDGKVEYETIKKVYESLGATCK